jgi:hypothetical protein
MVFGAGALLAIAACSNIDGVSYSYAGGGSAGSGSSSGSFGGTSGSSGHPDSTGQAFCSDRPLCGGRGCCPPGWRCLRDRCVAPGIACASDADCSGDRYCALALLEPRCFPRETLCDPDGGANEDCALATCAGPDLHLSRSESTCADVAVYVDNLGGGPLPAGAIITVEPRPTDAGAADADAGDDAGSPTLERVTGVTTDGILPGEVILMRIPAVPGHGALIARVDHDAGAAVVDCNPQNDTDDFYYSCHQVETP